MFLKIILHTLLIFTVRFFFLLFLSCTLLCCGNSAKPKPPVDQLRLKNELEKVNKYEVEKEQDEIGQYITHHQWLMEKTGSGLRYMILKKGNGKSPVSGNIVKVNYTISLLDGTVCYSSMKDGPYEFKVEGDEVESGLHEAVQLMHLGEKSKFILPSFLAHGLHGDDGRIPPLSSIEVDLELLEIL